MWKLQMENNVNKEKRLMKRMRHGLLSKYIHKTLSLFPSGRKAFQELYRQHISSSSLARTGSLRGSISDRWCRRQLRQAIQSRDIKQLQALIAQGVDTTVTLCDAMPGDTPLLYAARHGYVDVLEVLLHAAPTDRQSQHQSGSHGPSALDEAMKGLLVGPQYARHAAAARLRVIKCLLRHGLHDVSATRLDTALFSALHSRAGPERVARLVSIVAREDCQNVKGALLGTLSAYAGTGSYIMTLLEHGVFADSYVTHSTCVTSLPPHNAVLLVKYATHSTAVLYRLQYDATRHFSTMRRHWAAYEKLLRLLVVCGERLQISVTTYLYSEKARFYKWLVIYENQPKSLLDICRTTVRKQLRRNIVWSVRRMTSLPDVIKHVLLFEDLQ